jgi:hypothetical protein
MSISLPYRGRVITVLQKPEGFVWRFDDGAFFSDGLDFYSTRQAALRAAKTEIDAEEGGPLVAPQ